MMIKTGGLILLNKPPGITSFKALNSIKRELATGKVGHTGTLDKFAEGLIVALSGKMTKLVPEFTGMDKQYEAVITFGEETETLDPEGAVLHRAPVPSISDIERAIKGFSGKIMQAPPAFSAIHINGKRAYERVRSGEEVSMPEREIEIFKFEILSWESPRLKALIHCSKGTYIRSLARDLALASGSRAYLTGLKRLTVGPFNVEEAVSPDLFSGENDIFLPWAIMDHLPSVKKVIVTDQIASDVSMGKESVFEVIKEDLRGAEEYALFNEKKDMLALIKAGERHFSYRFVC